MFNVLEAHSIQRAIGEMVMFPCDAEAYQYRQGLLIGFPDNPSDVLYGSYRDQKIRQVADILYKGKMRSCWKTSLRPVEEDSSEKSKSKKACD